MSREIRKVLVIKLGALGDFVLALAAAKRIRAAHPAAHITLLTTPAYEGLAKLSPYFNEVWNDGRPAGFDEWLALVRKLRRGKFDRVYDLQTSNRSSALRAMLGPFPPQWSGIAVGASHRHRNPQRDQMHTLERQADQLRVAGVWPDAPVAPGSAPPPDLSWILRKYKEPRPVAGAPPPRPYALLVPGASEKRPEKRWPVELFGELAAKLRAAGLDVVVIGGPPESGLARIIQKYDSQARDLTGRTDFAQIAVLGARAALAVGNDTGPLHLIAAAGAPSVALFSSASDPVLCGPRGHVAVLQAESLSDMPVDMVLRTAMSVMTPR